MKLEGGSVRMYLDDCHLAAFLVDVLVERDQPRLTGLDEAGQRRDALWLVVESALPEPVGGDEDVRSGHGAPSSLDYSRARRLGRITKVSVQLNHTIVSCRDQQRSAAFLTGILGLPAPARFAHFLVVEADNGVSLDFAETTAEITPQHYAFLVGEEELDAAFARLCR